MADSLFSIANSLIQNLSSNPFAQASRAVGVYDDLQEINQNLSILKSLLLDAENKSSVDESVREWLKQLNEVFNDAQDLFDELDYEQLRNQVAFKFKAHGTIKDKLNCFFSTSSNPLVFRYRILAHVKRIKERLAMAIAIRQGLGLTIIDYDRRFVNVREIMTSSSVIASDIVGRENEKERIVKLLLQHNPNNDGHENLQVISIEGVSGVGKTTLAKLVFNDERIVKFFSLKLWVCLSVEIRFTIKGIVSKIVNSVDFDSTFAYTLGIDDLDMDQLSVHLRNRLANQKVLLVMDDVWYANRVEWENLRVLMQEVAEGSKILVTTRLAVVAKTIGTIPACRLECLSEQDSLSLFIKWAFKEGEHERYDGLVEVGRDIVRKCGGNPLALITLGSSLFSEFDIDEWIHVRDRTIWDLENSLMSALKLSYDQMPSYLKQCFAMFSLYPKDYAFDSFRVASLWRAHGLLPSPISNQILNHSAHQCLNELNSRSFLQDFVDYGFGFSFKIHSLMTRLARNVAGSDFQLIRSSDQTQCARHMSFIVGDLSSICPRLELERVRTILFPNAGVGANSRSFLNTISKCKSLRFLDLSDSTYETLSDSFGKLKHLRYLSLENNKNFKILPDSICKLHKLEFLILSGCSEFEAFPKGFKNLINLQHLEITTKLHVLPEDEIANLSSLRTLRINFCNNLKSLFGRVKLATLSELVVANCSSLESLPLDTEHFPMLETLSIDNCDKLELSGVHSDQNLDLRLKNLHFVCLPKLVTLPHWLQGSSKTLQYLQISSCNNLVELPKWLSSMKLLRTLRVTNCPNMLSPSNDANFQRVIKHLEIDGYLEVFKQSQRLSGESSYKHTFTDKPKELEEAVEKLE